MNKTIITKTYHKNKLMKGLRNRHHNKFPSSLGFKWDKNITADISKALSCLNICLIVLESPCS